MHGRGLYEVELSRGPSIKYSKKKKPESDLASWKKCRIVYTSWVSLALGWIERAREKLAKGKEIKSRKKIVYKRAEIFAAAETKAT